MDNSDKQTMKQQNLASERKPRKLSSKAYYLNLMTENIAFPEEGKNVILIKRQSSDAFQIRIFDHDGKFYNYDKQFDDTLNKELSNAFDNQYSPKEGSYEQELTEKILVNIGHISSKPLWDKVLLGFLVLVVSMSAYMAGVYEWGKSAALGVTEEGEVNSKLDFDYELYNHMLQLKSEANRQLLDPNVKAVFYQKDGTNAVVGLLKTSDINSVLKVANQFQKAIIQKPLDKIGSQKLAEQVLDNLILQHRVKQQLGDVFGITEKIDKKINQLVETINDDSKFEMWVETNYGTDEAFRNQVRLNVLEQQYLAQKGLTRLEAIKRQRDEFEIAWEVIQ